MADHSDIDTFLKKASLTPENKETVLEVLKKILPEREQWRLEGLEIIAQSKEPITSYKVTKKLNEKGLRTSVGSVHPFLDVLVDVGICERDPMWEKLPIIYKGARISKMGKDLWEVLKTKLGTSPSSA